MKLQRIVIFILLYVFCLSCSRNTPEMNTVQGPREESVFEEGRMNILFDDKLASLIEEDLAGGNLRTKSAELNSIIGSLGIKSMERLFPYAGRFEERTRKEGLHRWYTVSYDRVVTKSEAISSVSELEGVLLAEPIRKTAETSVFNDPMLSRQWHFINDGSISAFHSLYCDINVKKVWQDYTTGSSDVIVAVVDGGIDYAHEDLADNYAGGYNFVDNSETIVPEEHGTHVAGIIAARNNNGVGVCGIAGGDAGKSVDGVKLLSCQVFKPDPSNPSKTLSGSFSTAIKWGADHGAVISQNSWAYIYSSETDALRGSISEADKDAVDYFIKYAGIDENGNQTGPMKGGVVIFAAGNSAYRIGYPAAYEPIVAVAAVGPDFSRPSYTNYGSWVDICAPGGDMFKSKECGVLSTILNNGYGWQHGSSMACPHVSGIAALIVSHFGGPGFTNDMLKERLLAGANSKAIPQNDGLGPLADALGSFVYGTTVAPEPVKDFTLQSKLNTVEVGFDVTVDKDDGTAWGYVLAASEDRALLESFTGEDKPGVFTSKAFVDDRKVGDRISVSLSGLEFDKEYHLTVLAYDYAGNYSKAEAFRSFTPVNNPPKWLKVIDDRFFNELDESFDLNLDEYIYDPDGEALSYEVSVSDPAVLHVLKKDNVARITVLGYGMATVNIKAVDCQTSRDFSFKVLVREGDNIICVYPNPVVDVMNISSGAAATTELKLINQAGLVIMEASGISSAFDALKVDMSGCAPGRYIAKINYDGVEYTRAVVKL